MDQKAKYNRVQRDISRKVETSMLKLDTIIDEEELDEELKRQAREKRKELNAFREARAARIASEGRHHRRKSDRYVAELALRNGKKKRGRKPKEEKLTVYKARAALINHQDKIIVKEGAIHRTVRLIGGLIKLNKSFKEGPEITNEKKRALRIAVLRDCWKPVCDGAEDMVDTLWNFMCQFARDLGDCFAFIGEIFIRIAYYLQSAGYIIWDKYWDLRLWFDENRRWLFSVFAATVTLSVLGAVFFSSIVGYEYSYYGKSLGVARSKEDVYQTIEVLGDKLTMATGANVSINVERDIAFKRVIGFNMDVDSPDDILNTLTYMKDIQVRAFAININEKQVVILESQKVAEDVLDGVKNDFAPPKDNIQYTSLRFSENVAIEEVGVQLGDIWNSEEAKRYLETGTVKLNADATTAFLTVESTELSTVIEKLNYGTKYIDDPDLYIDETELVSAGKYGERKVVAQITRINGVETSKYIVSSLKTSNPVDEVRYQGTKPIPAKEGTGTFIYPLKKYTITSRFGMRWGSMHNGVDLAAGTGTKIYASDGGTVTYAGWNGTYGYVIYIDHGSLYETRYAHCSKLLVKVGDKVYQGQNIALVGSTGNSTGPHVHFEIRYKDKPYNPLNYL